MSLLSFIYAPINIATGNYVIFFCTLALVSIAYGMFVVGRYVCFQPKEKLSQVRMKEGVQALSASLFALLLMSMSLPYWSDTFLKVSEVMGHGFRPFEQYSMFSTFVECIYYGTFFCFLWGMYQFLYGYIQRYFDWKHLKKLVSLCVVIAAFGLFQIVQEDTSKSMLEHCFFTQWCQEIESNDIGSINIIIRYPDTEQPTRQYTLTESEKDEVVKSLSQLTVENLAFESPQFESNVKNVMLSFIAAENPAYRFLTLTCTSSDSIHIFTDGGNPETDGQEPYLSPLLNVTTIMINQLELSLIMDDLLLKYA